jgi:hypothetical protein
VDGHDERSAAAADAPSCPAGEVPATLAYRRRERRNTLAWLLVAVVLVAVGVCAFAAGASKVKTIAATGDAVPGEVYLESPGDGGKGFHTIGVRFRHDGTDRTALLGARRDRFSVGDEVTVYVDPDHPERVAVASTLGISGRSAWLASSAVLFGMVIAAAGAVTLAQTRRRVSPLGTEAWRELTAQWRQPSGGQRGVALVRLDTVDGPVVVRVEAHQRVSDRLHDGDVVWVCGNLSGRFLIAAPGGAPFVEAGPTEPLDDDS